MDTAREATVVSTARARRVAVVLTASLLTAAAMVISAGGAEASHCRDGLVFADTGVGIVGVKQSGSGALGTTQNVSVCADPPHQEQGVSVSVPWYDWSPWLGATVSAGTCGTVVCTALLGTTGATTVFPTASADEPLDGDNVTGASVNMGGGVCAWVNGTPTGCQLSGSTGHYAAAGDPPPPSVHPAVDPTLGYLHQLVLYGVYDYAYWCTDLLFHGFTVEETAILCAYGALQLP